MRLIDYDEIRKLFDEEYKRTMKLIRSGETHLDNLAEGYVGADKVIYKLPDVDAVEVIRCKNCEYLKFSDCYGECSRGYMGIVSPDDFCSRAVKKDRA